MNVSLYQAAAALNANARWQEVIAENLSSSGIPGFKRQDVSFAAIQAGLMETSPGTATGLAPRFGLTQAATATNFSPGELRPTGVETDVALEGDGFFEVSLPDGTPAYTRDGEFTIDPQGRLVTKLGYAVMGDAGPIQIDPNLHGPLGIGNSGQITKGTQAVGRLKVVEFEDPRRLTAMGGGYLAAQDPLALPNEVAQPRMRQKFLEGANTTPAVEMANLMSALRAYEANQRLIQVQDERMGRAISSLAGTD